MTWDDVRPSRRNSRCPTCATARKYMGVDNPFTEDGMAHATFEREAEQALEHLQECTFRAKPRSRNPRR